MGPGLRRDDVEFVLTAKQKRRSGFFIRSGAAASTRALRRVVAGDGLDLEIFLQPVFAPFAAIAGLLVAAERRGAVVRHALQIDVAGADAAADPARGLDRVGGDVTGKAIRCVVSDLDGFLL